MTNIKEIASTWLDSLEQKESIDLFVEALSTKKTERDVIKRALMSQHHPDRKRGSEVSRLFIQINAFFDVIKTIEKSEISQKRFLSIIKLIQNPTHLHEREKQKRFLAMPYSTTGESLEYAFLSATPLELLGLTNWEDFRKLSPDQVQQQISSVQRIFKILIDEKDKFFHGSAVAALYFLEAQLHLLQIFTEDRTTDDIESLVRQSLVPQDDPDNKPESRSNAQSPEYIGLDQVAQKVREMMGDDGEIDFDGFSEAETAAATPIDGSFDELRSQDNEDLQALVTEKKQELNVIAQRAETLPSKLESLFNTYTENGTTNYTVETYQLPTTIRSILNDLQTLVNIESFIAKTRSRVHPESDISKQLQSLTNKLNTTKDMFQRAAQSHSVKITNIAQRIDREYIRLEDKNRTLGYILTRNDKINKHMEKDFFVPLHEITVKASSIMIELSIISTIQIMIDMNSNSTTGSGYLHEMLANIQRIIDETKQHIDDEFTHTFETLLARIPSSTEIGKLDKNQVKDDQLGIKRILDLFKNYQINTPLSAQIVNQLDLLSAKYSEIILIENTIISLSEATNSLNLYVNDLMDAATEYQESRWKFWDLDRGRKKALVLNLIAKCKDLLVQIKYWTEYLQNSTIVDDSLKNTQVEYETIQKQLDEIESNLD